MIITRNHALRLIHDGKATLEGRVRHEGSVYWCITRHDIHRVDHYPDHPNAYAALERQILQSQD